MSRFLQLLVILIPFIYSCEDEHFSRDPSLKLSFSTDTIMFDTVFTTIGSSTKYLKVYNRNKHDLKIASIQLAGGNSSFFRINVDGQPADKVYDVSIRSKDSLYIFIEVTVDPTNQNSPLFISDSIVFNTNGNTQEVKLIAWGQDVHLLNARTFVRDTFLISDKPYLIYDYLYVKQGAELKIQQGARFHLHNEALVLVAGSLKIEGTFENPVTFEGDRLEPYYRDKAGQWWGIWLSAGSRENEIRWANIKNAIVGLVVDTCYTPGIPTLKISNSIVMNMSSTCLLGRGSKIIADNCLFANAGGVGVNLIYGGAFQFFHCTIANYWGQFIFRKGPALSINNYYAYQLVENGPWIVDPRDIEEAYFNNCIVYGSRSLEFEVDNKFKDQPVQALMNYRFDHCILKVPSDYSLADPSKYINVIKDDPKFKDPYKLVFELDTLSPAKDFGLLEYGQQYPFDLKNLSHILDLKPDLGAYERKEN